MLAMNEKHWLFNWLGPTMMLMVMEMAEKRITDPDTLMEQLNDTDDKYINIMVDWRRTLPVNSQKARDLLHKVSCWITESNKEFALGTDTYTLGDVLVTNLMSRLVTNKAFF